MVSREEAPFDPSLALFGLESKDILVGRNTKGPSATVLGCTGLNIDKSKASWPFQPSPEGLGEVVELEKHLLCLVLLRVLGLYPALCK